MFKHIQGCENKRRPPKWEKADYLFRTFYSKWVRHCHLHLAETQRQLEDWEDFIVKKKKKRQGFTCALIGGYWLGEAGGRLSRDRASYMIGLEGNTDICWLILSLNEERKQKQLSGTLDKVLTISRLIAAGVWLPGLHLWTRVLFLYLVWPLHVYLAF